MVALPAAETAEARGLILAGAARAAPGRTRTPRKARSMRRVMCRCGSVAASGRETPTVEPRGGVRLRANRTPHRRPPRVPPPRCGLRGGRRAALRRLGARRRPGQTVVSVRASAGGRGHDAGALLVALGRQHACFAALSALILALSGRPLPLGAGASPSRLVLVLANLLDASRLPGSRFLTGHDRLLVVYERPFRRKPRAPACERGLPRTASTPVIHARVRPDAAARRARAGRRRRSRRPGGRASHCTFQPK